MRERAVRLIFQFDAINKKENAIGVGRADEQFGDGCAQKRFARAGGHFKQEAVVSFCIGFLQRNGGGNLIVAQEFNVLIQPDGFALCGWIIQPVGVLRDGDVVFIYFCFDELLRIGIPARGFAELFQRKEMRNAGWIALR
jgi:hypothetical protein